MTRWALEIPCGLSLLVAHDADAVIPGLDRIPRDEWPPVLPVHLAFQVMVGIGMYLLGLSAWAAFSAWRGRPPWRNRALLLALVPSGPLAFLAIEAGWTVTEVGRQPWIIYGVLRVEDAVTPMPGLVVPFATFTLLYVFLAGVVATLLVRLARVEGDGGAEALP